MSEPVQIASLFPLNTVLFPGSVLQLKIFEQRYLDLIKICMRNSHGFVVVLINEGHEVNDTPTIYCVGTYVDITDFETLENGLLGITIKASYKVHIKNTKAQHDGLLNGEITKVIEDDVQYSEQYHHLKDVLESLVKHPLLKPHHANINYQSASEISFRLSEFLPTSNINKQELLETTSTEDRLDKIETLLDQLQS